MIDFTPMLQLCHSALVAHFHFLKMGVSQIRFFFGTTAKIKQSSHGPDNLFESKTVQYCGLGQSVEG